MRSCTELSTCQDVCILPYTFPANVLISSIFSMLAFHLFSTARESLLAIWSPVVQARRQVPDARLLSSSSFSTGSCAQTVSSPT